MKDDTATGELCPTCRMPVIITRDGSLCTKCTGLSKAAPAAVAVRGLRAVAALRRQGRSGVFRMES